MNSLRAVFFCYHRKVLGSGFCFLFNGELAGDDAQPALPQRLRNLTGSSGMSLLPYMRKPASVTKSFTPWDHWNKKNSPEAVLWGIWVWIGITL